MIILAIDIKKGITNDKLYNFNGFVSNTTRILDTARKNGIEIIYFQHDDGPSSGFSVGDSDFLISDLFTPQSNEMIFVKEVNSCFGNKKFVEYLESKNDKELMIVGLQTNFCIDATVKSAFDREYHVVIPEGTNSTFDNEYMSAETTYKYYNNMMWPERFAECVTIEEALQMLNN